MAEPAPWEMDWSNGAPGPVYGAPPKPDKPDQPKTTYRPLSPEEVKARGLPEGTYQESSEGKIDSVAQAKTATVDEKKIATLVTRIAGGFNDIKNVTAKDPSAQEPGVIETLRGGLEPGGLMGIPARAIAGGNRRTVFDSQRDVLDALLTLGTGAAYNDEQLSGAMVSHFPQYNDSEEEIAVKNQRLERLIAAAKANAGPAWTSVEPTIQQYMQGGATKQDAPPPAGLIDPNAGVSTVPPGPMPPPGGDGGGQRVVTGDKKTISDSSLSDAMFAMLQAGAPYESIYAFARQHGEVSWSKEGFDKAVKYWYKERGKNPFTPQEKQVDTTWRERAAAGDAAAFASSVGDAFTGGRMDEIAGGLAALGGGDYTTARDSFDAKKRAVADLNPVVNTVGSITGGVLAGATGAGAASRFAPGAAGYVTNALARIPGAAPAAGGAAYGAYYGSGDDNQNRLTGGAIGATIGGLTGGAVGRAQNALANRSASNAVRGSNAQAMAQAGDAEQITINRALVEPKYQNKVSGVDASTLGGPKFQAGMQQIEGEFADAAGRLGRGGQALSATNMGMTLKDAGERAIAETGKIAKAKYDRAVNMAGDTKVKPAMAVQQVDEAIAKLSETPETFKAELAYLNGLKKDLSNDLSVEGLRRLRTTQRNKISKGDLVFGEDEARVLGIMDAAAQDIRNGLTAAGKGNAAKAFDTADKAYRARMEYINGTIQRVIGKRNSNRAAGDIASAFNGLTKKDTNELRRFQASLTREERDDVAATFAAQIGKSAKNDFSVGAFMTATGPKGMGDDAVRALFGNDGWQSVQNLRTIGKELERVTSGMNSRTSKTAPALNWQTWLWQAALGGGLGYAGGGDSTTALAGAAALAGGKGAREYMTAKMLLNPNITKWLKMAPKTTNPRAIDAHFAKLQAIAKTSPALADDIERFSQAIFSAANDNAGVRAAAGDGEKDQ